MKPRKWMLECMTTGGLIRTIRYSRGRKRGATLGRILHIGPAAMTVSITQYIGAEVTREYSILVDQTDWNKWQPLHPRKLDKLPPPEEKTRFSRILEDV